MSPHQLLSNPDFTNNSQHNPISRHIDKWDIFYDINGLLHHSKYRQAYQANQRRERPRIPCAPDFWAAGKQLADLHVNYEQQEE